MASIFLIERKDEPRGTIAHWDQNLAHVIVANDEKQVRRLAKRAAEGGEPEDLWTNPKKHRISKIGEASANRTKPRIILTSNAGS
jgi:hypothetical protein